METSFDYAKALEQLGGDEELLKNMLSSFVQHGKNAMSKLCALKDSGEMEPLQAPLLPLLPRPAPPPTSPSRCLWDPSPRRTPPTSATLRLPPPPSSSRLQREAHSLKGSSSFIAARYLPKLAGQLEKAARENEEGVPYVVGQILHQFNLLEKDIEVRRLEPASPAACPPAS